MLAALAAVGAAGAVLVSRRGGGRYAVVAAVCFALLASWGATISDASNSRQVRHDLLPSDLSWVDSTGLQDVTLLQTVGSPPAGAIEQLYWNRSIKHEALVGDARATDVYAAPHIDVARDGTLRGLGSNVLVQDYAATVQFANATTVASATTFTLWAAEGLPRLSLLEQGRFNDGWLGRSGKLSIWPDATGRSRGRLSFTLSLPTTAVATTVKFGKASYGIRPGEQKTITYTLDARGPWSLAFTTPTGGNALPDLRFTSVRSTPPVLTRGGAPDLRATSSA